MTLVGDCHPDEVEVQMEREILTIEGVAVVIVEAALEAMIAEDVDLGVVACLHQFQRLRNLYLHLLAHNQAVHQSHHAQVETAAAAIVAVPIPMKNLSRRKVVSLKMDTLRISALFS